MLSTLNTALMGYFVWSGVLGANLAEAKEKLPVPAPVEYSVRLTGYNAVPEQTDNDPETTASGAKSNPEVIAARSRDFAGTMPFGTVIELESPNPGSSCGYDEVKHLVGYRVIADTTHMRKKGQVDVLFGTKTMVSVGGKPTNAAVAIGVCDAIVRVVGRVDPKNIPQTQAELAALVESNDKLARN